MKRTSVLVPENFLSALTELATKRGTTVSQLVRDAIYELLKGAGMLVLLMVVGCGGGHGGSEHQAIITSEYVAALEDEEDFCPPVDTECPEGIDYFKEYLRGIMNQVRVEIVPRNTEYMQTSCEALRRGEADDIGASMVIKRALNESFLAGFYGLDARTRIINDNGEERAVVILYTDAHGTFTIDGFDRIWNGEYQNEYSFEF